MKDEDTRSEDQRIYLSPPHLDGDERELLQQVVDSNWITTLGPQVDAFEGDMCSLLGVASAVAVSSGTAALHLALLVLGVRKGDVVLCSDLTFVASANPIMYCDAEPIFIDSETDSWNMDPGLLEEALASLNRTNRLPKAVVVVDLYGQAADYAAIQEICTQYDVPVIEDAAEALGATYRQKFCGAFGAMGVLSFNGNKIVTTSGGGMLVSQNAEHVSRAEYLANQAADSLPYYQHATVGYNYRLSNVLAALGRAQLARLEAKVTRRREVFDLYRKGLSGLPGISFMPEAPGCRSNRWLTCITLDPKQTDVSPDELREHLESGNIQSRPLWKPMHMQPVFEGCRTFGGGCCRVPLQQGVVPPLGEWIDRQRR